MGQGNFVLWTALKAKYWTRCGGAGPFSTGGKTYDLGVDNTFQDVAYDPLGNKVNTIVYCDANGFTQFNNPNGVLFAGALATPTAPTVTPNTAGGATTVAYAIVARTASGAVTGVSANGSSTTSQTTLSTTVFNTIVGARQAGAAFYDVYRITAPTTPSTTGKIGTVTAQSLITTPGGTTFTFVDNGAAGDGSTAPTFNTTGQISAPNGFASGLSSIVPVVTVLTAANIAAMNGAPVSVVSAPGANKALVVDQITLQIKPTATQFTGGGVITFVYHGGSVNPHGSSIAAAQMTSATASLNLLPPNAGSIVIPLNTGIDITNATAAFATGTGTAVVTTYLAVQTQS